MTSPRKSRSTLRRVERAAMAWYNSDGYVRSGFPSELRLFDREGCLGLPTALHKACPSLCRPRRSEVQEEEEMSFTPPPKFVTGRILGDASEPIADPTSPMADDALTRKEAEMDGLREFIEEKRSHFNTKLGYMPLDERTKAKCRLEIALCDLALRALSLESVREEAALRNDECWEIIRALDAEGKASSLIGYPLTDTNRPTIRAWLQKRIDERNLQHAPARVAEGEATPKEKS